MNDTANTTTRHAHELSSKVILIALGIFVVVAAVLYYVGMTQGRKELAAQKTQYEQQLQQSTQALDKSGAELADVRNRNHLMHARVAIYQTAIDLDQRNFGVASDRLHEAADALGNIGSGSSGIDVAKVATLKQTIETSDFTVAADLESQRARVLAFAAELDAIAANHR
ncbi:MAG: hypothetical protein ABIO84_00595 [Lysobacter sp.]